MKPGFGATLTTMRAMCRLIADQLMAEHGSALASNPRLLFFPKRVHELGFNEGVAPNGLGPAYVTLATALNKAQTASAKNNNSAVETLLRVVEQTVHQSLVNERHLTEMLNQIHENRCS